MEETKKCTSCGHEKPIDEFYLRKKGGTTRHARCKKCDYECLKIYTKNNPEKIKEINTKYRKTDKNKEVSKRYYGKYKDKIKEYYSREDIKEKNRVAKLAPHRKVVSNQYAKNKYKTDLQYNIAKKMRVRINKELKNVFTDKSEKTMDLLGCTYAEYLKYIESLFTPQMTWDGVISGEIHVDHITVRKIFNKIYHSANLFLLVSSYHYFLGQFPDGRP